MHYNEVYVSPAKKRIFILPFSNGMYLNPQQQLNMNSMTHNGFQVIALPSDRYCIQYVKLSLYSSAESFCVCACIHVCKSLHKASIHIEVTAEHCHYVRQCQKNLLPKLLFIRNLLLHCYITSVDENMRKFRSSSVICYLISVLQKMILQKL